MQNGVWTPAPCRRIRRTQRRVSRCLSPTVNPHTTSFTPAPMTRSMRTRRKRTVACSTTAAWPARYRLAAGTCATQGTQARDRVRRRQPAPTLVDGNSGAGAAGYALTGSNSMPMSSQQLHDSGESGRDRHRFSRTTRAPGLLLTHGPRGPSCSPPGRTLRVQPDSDIPVSRHRGGRRRLCVSDDPRPARAWPMHSPCNAHRTLPPR